MTHAATLAVVVLAGCGRIGFDDVMPSDGSIPPPPPPVCTTPPQPDVSTATIVTACDEASVRAAISAGGVIKLSCGAGTRIPFSSEILVMSDTIIDGGSAHFDGQGITRLFHLMPPSAPALTLIDVVIENGKTAQSGGAILVESGSLTVFGSAFVQNHAAAASSSEGGGAISAKGLSVFVTLFGTVFTNNSASNGGAIHVFSNLTIANALLIGNSATGSGGSTGQGGLGGAIEATGNGDLTLCGVSLLSNSAGAIGGAIHRVSLDAAGIDWFDRTRIEGNTAASQAGGAYLQDTSLRLRQVSIASNSAGTVGGLWHQSSQGFDAENVTIADNRSTTALGAGLSVNGPGTLAFSTVANNHAQCPECWAVIYGAQNLTLISSIVANNQADDAGQPASCAQSGTDGGTNFQWPSETPLCASGATVVDPQLAGLVDKMGPAGIYPMRVPAAGSVVVRAAASCPTEDMLGNPRPTPCTAGAVEP